MKESAHDDLLIYSLGMLMLEHIKEDELLREAIAAAETAAIKTLEEIKGALDDETLDDPECFRRIEAILTMFEDNGTGAHRHDF